MLRFCKNLLLASMTLAAAFSAGAFTLIGPFPTWQSVDWGYQLSRDIGGPVNLGEEYRWAVPTIIYSFDESFLNYFGERGVIEVEKALKVINDLPPVSAMDLSKYPLNTTRINYRASALGLQDMKSYTLSRMLAFLGISTPERYVFAIRHEWHDPVSALPNWIIVKRNFDPETWEPTSYVNGQLYTYRTIRHTDTPTHLTYPLIYPVDPLKPSFTAVADHFFYAGQYVTGLTRDDVGGLRYLYRANNFNVENLPQDAQLSTNVWGSWNPWGYTNASGATVVISTNWYPISTNMVGTNSLVGNTNTVSGTNTATLISTALRAGREKITFQRANYDSTLGFWINVTNEFTDNYITNGITYQQKVMRIIAAPDFVFAARDLGPDAANNFPWLAEFLAPTWVNNDALNGTVTLDGPGTVEGPITFTYSKIGPWYYNGPGFLSEASATTTVAMFAWAAFDGSTNEPVVFPKGTSIKALERQILGY